MKFHIRQTGRRQALSEKKFQALEMLMQKQGMIIIQKTVKLKELLPGWWVKDRFTV